jgi:hypothetical protein
MNTKIMALVVSASACGAALGQDGLIVGFDDTAAGVTSAWIRSAGAWEPLFSYGAPDNADVWGLATDPATCTLYVASGVDLFRLQPGGSLARVGTITVDGSNVAITGLAWLGGRLIGYRNVTDEGFYGIDPATGVATRLWTQTVGGFLTAYDFGGIDSDGTTLYGMSDTVPAGGTRGLHTIDLTTNTITLVVEVTAFPGNPGGSSTDVDGLAVGDGRAFLIVDQPGDVQVYNLTTNAFEASITNPFPTSEIFSAGAWAPCFLTPTCAADFNNDGFLDFFDYDAFVECFETEICPPGKTADFNNDAFVDFFDYDDFVNAFETGC